MVSRVYRKNNEYGNEYYDGRSERSYNSSSLSVGEARTLRKTLSNSFENSAELGLETSNDFNINGTEDQPEDSLRKISTGDEERCARKISANTSLVNVTL